MSVLLNISLSKTQLPDGRWLLYYNGDNIDLDCGTYFLKVDVNGIDYYSELFTVKSISSNVHPGLIFDISHLPLRIYNQKTKQDYFRCRNLCDVGILNPINKIIPFAIDITGLTGLNNPIITKIICHDGMSEYDLSGELQYHTDLVSNVIIQTGVELSGQLFCGIYYLQITIGNNIFYSEHFKVENVTDIPIENIYLYTESNTPTGFEQIVTEDGQVIIL